MQISKIQQKININPLKLQDFHKSIVNNNVPQQIETNTITPPVTYQYGAKINFCSKKESFQDPNKTIPDIDYEEYKAMTEVTKKRFRKKYQTFTNNEYIDKKELVDPKYQYLPLRSEKTMDEFLKMAKYYSQFKDQNIICLGRSPKWFLNAALWMKDGIDDYKFVAFSQSWYRPDPIEGMRFNKFMAPTEEETKAYRKYLKRIKADPKTIVDNWKNTGKRTVITDYIFSGKGVTSFLDILGNYAKDENILEDFSKAIQIVGIGSMDYVGEMNPHLDTISQPRVIMPPVLQKYEKNIPQSFKNMEETMFKEMLINQNTNECRSTWYPHQAWTVYRPDRFKTGLIKDMKKVAEVKNKLKEYNKISVFAPAMADYRNLLNFRILDALDSRKILKAVHKSKV